MKKLTKLLAVSASLLMATSVFAQTTLQGISKSGELRTCFEAGYMPFEMKAKNGDFIGFDIDMAKAMAKSIGVKFVPVNTAWDGIIPALLTNKCDVIIGGMTITQERNLKVNFSHPYIVVGQSILLNPKLKGKVTSYKDLNNSKYKVASKLGTTGANAVERYIPKAHLSKFDTETDGVLEVVNGKADAFVYDLPFNSIYAAQHKGKIVHLSKVFTYEPLAVAVRPGDADILNFVNNFIAQIKGDGTYDRIHHKWFETDGWLKKIQ